MLSVDFSRSSHSARARVSAGPSTDAMTSRLEVSSIGSLSFVLATGLYSWSGDELPSLIACCFWYDVSLWYVGKWMYVGKLTVEEAGRRYVGMSDLVCRCLISCSMVGIARSDDVGQKSSCVFFFTVGGLTTSTKVEELGVCSPSSGVGIRCRRSGEYQSDELLSSAEAESTVGSSGKLATITGDDVVVVRRGAEAGKREQRRKSTSKINWRSEMLWANLRC